MARVELSAAAFEDLDTLIGTHTLPGDTRARARSSLRALEQFPQLRPELSGRWEGCRFLLGPGAGSFSSTSSSRTRTASS